MAKTLEQLLSLSSIIANETKAGANTALRIGGLFSDIIYYLRDLDYAGKDDIPSLDGYATEQWVLGKGYATTSDLDNRIDALVNGAPQAYDTLKEIADVLAGNVNSISDILTALGNKADKATTLSGYGITDAYTITQIDSIVDGLSDDISTLGGYFTGGVANSANKLATARTIWGQSFDGTGNVSGHAMGLGGTIDFQFSDEINRYGGNLYLQHRGDGSQTGTGSGATGNVVMCKNGGNVLIGTSTDNGYKLDVNGTTRTTKLVIGNGSIEWDETNNGFKIVGGLYTESYLSAKGANSSGGSSSGGGLITSLYRYADLGKTFADTNNDTFNAYTINKINSDLGSRISVLEGKATNVSFTQSLTSGTQIGSISIDGVAKNIYAPTIPTDDINKGVTAYGWGNHANAGYAMASALGDYQTKITSSNKLDYSLISGVPTKLSQFTNDLGLGTFAYKSSLAFADLTDKPTTIGGYGITDAITTANIGSQSVDNADKLGGYYSYMYVKSLIDNTDDYLSFRDRAIFRTSLISGQGDFGALIIPTWTGNNTNNYYLSELRFENRQYPRFRCSHNGVVETDWKTFAFTDSNVASATKLQNARTLWGQSFNGESDVNGSIIIDKTQNRYDDSPIKISANANGGKSGYRILNCHYSNMLDGSSMLLYFGVSESRFNSGYIKYDYRGSSNNLNALSLGFYGADDLLCILASGNVGIGTTSPQYKLDVDGVIHSSTGIFSDGYVSAKGQNTSSDMRLKNVLNEVVLNVSDIANAPSMRFSWKNGGGVDVGSSAQYWQRLLPDAVKERDGMLEMQYANIALLSAIALAKNFETHEERIARLERENKELRNEINMMKGGNYA